MKTLITLDLAKIISTDLISRSVVALLCEHIEQERQDEVIIDFANVKFATRSFMDEFFNKIINNKTLATSIKLINVPNDIEAMLDSVSKTQVKKKKTSSGKSSVMTFRTVGDVKRSFNILAL